MNSLTNLTTAKIRRMFLIAALLICPVLAVQNGNAQGPTATGTLTGSGGSSTINITGNQQFTLTLAISTNFEAGGYTVFYLVSNNGSGLFQIVGRMNLSPMHPATMMPVFNDPTTPDSSAFGGMNGIMDPFAGANPMGSDFGYTGDQTNNQPMGSYSLQMITINALNAPVGQYFIMTDRAIMTDRTGGGFEDRPFMTMATINVIPEPTTVGLAVIGGGMLLVAGWRKRRARA